MRTSDSIAAARDQLNRTLSFFSRVDSKASFLFGVNTAMLAVLSAQIGPYSSLRWEWAPIALTVLMLALSYFHLYKQAFPSLDGGNASLLYFREIAKRTELGFAEEWLALSDEQHLKDLLGQVWRNAEILNKKFDHLKSAFFWLALALVPWMLSIGWLSLSTAPMN